MNTEESINIPVSNRRKKYNLLIFACFFLYSCSMASKTVFTAELVTVLDVLNITKVQASLANTYYFITYAALQVGLTFFIGKIDIKKYLAFTLPVSAVVCIVIPFITALEGLWAVFALNGLAQAGIWSGCILILSKYLPFEYVSKANKLLTVGGVAGNTFANGIAAGAVAINAWELGFIGTGVLFLCSIALFAFVVFSFRGTGVNRESSGLQNVKQEKPQFILTSKKRKIAFYVFSCIVALLSCSLYYSVYNWLATYFKDVWGMPDSYAILLTVVFPIVMSVGPIIGLSYFDKRQNFVKGEIVFLIIPLIVSILLIFLFEWNLIVALLLLVVYIVLIKAVNVLYSGAAAFNMRSQLNSGSYSALTNAFASVSAGVTPTIVGALIENYGYRAQFIFVAITACVLMLFLVLSHIATKNKLNID